MEIVLNSYGAKLSINNGAFMLNNSTGSHRIPVKDVDSILVAKSVEDGDTFVNEVTG